MSRSDIDVSGGDEPVEMMAAEVLVRSLRDHGVTHAFCNLGTDHPPLLEAAAKVRAEDGKDCVPDFVTCLHESVALSAAHGYAVATGEPQAVIVHVDVGTQNLGAMLHNAHRGDAPVFIFAGLAPNSQWGHNASRSNSVHFLQDVFDQEGIVEEYCQWSSEFRLPGDPDELVTRGLELAASPRKGPVYLTATGEALEATVKTRLGDRSANPVRPTPADAGTVAEVAERVDAANAPLVITSKLGIHNPEYAVSTLRSFAEKAGAGVVEARPAGLNFPRTHDLHMGFDPDEVWDRADLIILAEVDVPWVPAPASAPPEGVPIIQIDTDPLKSSYPQWDIGVDLPIAADPAPTLERVADRLEGNSAATDTWEALHSERINQLETIVQNDRRKGRLSPAVLTSTLNSHIDDSTIVVDETTTNMATVWSHLKLDRPGSYLNSHGSGLGWANGAAIGVKMGLPDHRVVSLVGDGSYVFGQPTASAWMAEAYDAPTLTIIYNNSCWNAVRGATRSRHPDGHAADLDVPESRFEPTLDLSHATHVVDAHSRVIDTFEDLESGLSEGFDAIDSGQPSVLDVRVDQQ